MKTPQLKVANENRAILARDLELPESRRKNASPKVLMEDVMSYSHGGLSDIETQPQLSANRARAVCF
jgi:hypothetical protein